MQQILSILTITRDDFEGVAATVRSTRKMRTYEGVRQIVIDGSIESVSQRVRQLTADEQHIDYVWQEPCGIAQAFNLGISQVSDGFIWFLNGRDEVHPDLDIPLFMNLLCSSKVDILIFELEFMGSRLAYKRPPLWSLWPPIFWMPHPATIIRRKLFDTYGCFRQDFKIAMDGELWIRLLSNDIGVDMISIPISLYDQNGISSTDPSKMFLEIDRVIKGNFRLLFKIWLKQGLYLYQALKRSIAAKILPRGGTN
jgi:glycosyltransferase involved in cell wall biosynthesis